MKAAILLALFIVAGFLSKAQEVISFPLSEDLNSTDGAYSLTALANEDGETGMFGTLATNSSCAAVPSTSAYFFNDNAGLQFSNNGFIDRAYSLEMTFKLDELLIRSTRTSDWVNLVSFNQTLSDRGIYVFITTEGSGLLQFWDSSSSTEPVTGEIFNETDLFHLVLTRSASGFFSIYVNGVIANSPAYDDVDDAYLPNDTDDDIYFFRDFPLEAIPTITDKLDDEASPGWVRLLNIANYEWTGDEITNRFNVVCDRLTTPQFSSEGVCLNVGSSFELTTDVSSADSIQWDFGDGTVVNEPGLDSVFHNFTAQGSYLVEVTTFFAGIGNANSETITINGFPTVDLGADRTFQAGEQVILDATNTGSTYLWQDGSTDSVLIATMEDTYSVTVTNEFGCSSSDEINLTLEAADIPNAFSPNGDGINDVWVIRTIDSYPNHTLRVFDRQGNLIREWTDYQNDWDGSVDGTPGNRATYFYILLSDDQMVARGSVSVIK